MENIYGNFGSQSQGPIEDTSSSNIEPVYIDGDDPTITLMKCIQAIKKITDDTPSGQDITIYIVKGNEIPTTFRWEFLFQYLESTGNNMNINFYVMFRGFFTLNGMKDVFNNEYKHIIPLLSKDIVVIDRGISNGISYLNAIGHKNFEVF